MKKLQDKPLRCKQCGRLQTVLANNRLKLCRACYFQYWSDQVSMRYRQPTAVERDTLDEAKEKLVVAFLKGDMHTWVRCQDVLQRTLAKMRVSKRKQES